MPPEAVSRNLKLIDTLNLVQNADEIGAHLKKALQDALGDHPNVGDIRGEGLLCAVEFVEDKSDRAFFDPSRTVGAQVNAGLLRRGIISRAMPEGDILGFAPPFCLSTSEADEIAGKLAEAVTETLG